MKPLLQLVFLKKRSKEFIRRWWIGGILLLLVFSHWSHAQPCQVIISSQSIDYGKITPDNTYPLESNQARRLPERHVSLTVICAETTRDIVLKLSGTTSSSDPHFVFGDNGRTKIELVNPSQAYSAIELKRLNAPSLLVNHAIELLAEDRLHIAALEGKKPLTLQLRVTPQITEEAWSGVTASELTTAMTVSIE